MENTTLNKAIKDKDWTLVKELLGKPFQIDEHTLNYALCSGNITIICDVIEAGAIPNQDSLMYATFSAPIFLKTVANVLIITRGEEIKKSIVDQYGQINEQSISPFVSSEELKRIESLEQKIFWEALWKKSINPLFHVKHVREPLKNLISSLEIKPGEGIFVPFCGKSIDMLWLKEQGYNVLGIDISKEVIDIFCKEHALQYKETQQETFIVRQVDTEKGSLKLLCGDIFNLKVHDVDKIGVIYDHAGFIAIPEGIRTKYAEFITSLFPKGTKMILGLIGFRNENPPPHNVGREEVNNYLKYTCFLRVKKNFSQSEICEMSRCILIYLTLI